MLYVNAASSIVFVPEAISKLEEMKNSKFVCDTCIKDKQHNWVNKPMALFYSEERHPVSNSHYFVAYLAGVDAYTSMMGVYVTNGQSAVDEPFTGVAAKNGEVIYSRYRHDMRKSSDESVWVDGGRDYVITGPKTPLVKLKIEGSEIKIVEVY